MSLLNRKSIVSMICVSLFIFSAFYIISPADNNYHVHGAVIPKMTIAMDGKNFTNSSIPLYGLIDPVSVMIDSSGVAHIYAKNNHDLFYSQGYFTASQRLFQMEFQTASVAGYFSNVIGTGAYEASLMQQIPETAHQLDQYYKTNYPQYYSYLHDYAAGVNAYINSSSNSIPLGFKLIGQVPYQWNVYDTLVWQQNMAFGLMNGKANTLRNDAFLNAFGYSNVSLIWPDYPYFTQNITVVPGNGTVNGYNLSDQGVTTSYFWSQNFYSQWATGVNLSLIKNLTPLINSAITNMTDPYLNVFDHRAYSSFVGSNEWIVTANYSKDHNPMLENDPHLGLTLPNLFMPLQLSDPQFNVTGWELIGTPGLLIGHTRYTSWGLTTPGGYNGLEYLEILNGSSYLSDGHWYPLQMVNYTVGGQNFSISYTNNGPLVGRQGNYGVSFNWAGGHDALDIIAILLLDQSRNYNDMLTALQYWGSPPQNFALVSMNSSGILTAGKYPLVNVTLPDGRMVSVVGSQSLLNGSLSEYEPTGFVPFKYLPQTKNPSRGYAYAPNQPLAGLNYPYPFIAEVGGEGGRAHTISTYLGDHPNMTVNDMIQLQSNVTAPFAKMFMPILENALSGMTMNSTESTAYDLMTSWNFTDYTNEVGPTVFWYLRMMIYNDSFQKIYSGKSFSAQGLPVIATTIYLAEHDPNSPWFNGNFTKLAREAFTQAVSFLQTNINTNVSDWTWGTVHELYIPSFLSFLGVNEGSYGPVPYKGGSHTVSVAGVSSLQLSVPLSPATTSSVLKEISSPAMNQFYGVFAGGLSENYTSYYYSNQLNYWLTDNYYNMSNQPTVFSMRYLSANYTVSFVRTGIPAGTAWSVTFNGITNTTAGALVTFRSYNGTYSFSVSNVSGFLLRESSGSITVDGENITHSVEYMKTYVISFVESGLPQGTSWSVSLNGTPRTSTDAMINFTVVNGTYVYSVGTVSGYNIAKAEGNITVSGSSVSQTENFTKVSSPQNITIYYEVAAALVAMAIAATAITLFIRRKR